MKVTTRKKLILKLLDRDGNRCMIAGAHCCWPIGIEIDHIRPIRTQDKNYREWDLRHPDMDNLQLACFICNQEKH